MGSGEEWANEGKGGWSCPITLAGIASAVALAGFGVFVVVTDVVKLFA